MNGLSKEKSMTVREAAEALGVSHDLVSKRVKELFPNIVKNGKTTRLNEAQITAVKMRIQETGGKYVNSDQ